MSVRSNRIVRQTLTIARRDFVATVFTPTFLLFLLSPIIMLSFGLVGAGGATSMATNAADKAQIVAIVAPERQAAMRATDARLRKLFGRSDQPPVLTFETPGTTPATQARAVFAGAGPDTTAALYGDLAAPTILYGAQGRGDSRYLAELSEGTLRAAASGARPLSAATFTPIARERASSGGHSQAAFFSVFGIFFLSLLLSGQAVGTMAEERNNKVIEILAAAVPLEAVFFGKLLGMFGSAVLFVGFWGTLASQLTAILPASMAGGLGEIGPAIGLPLFVPLFFAYFAMAYMLLGAVFLGVGAQATTPRELQMLSLPITIVQVLMFSLALRAAGGADNWVTRFAEIFPFSSPFAMAAHAANFPHVWPHLLALAWQALWVGIAITIGARAFRRGVLQSGSGSWFKRRVATVGEALSGTPTP
ncbi:ABC transporter permease [Sphingomonas sp. NFR15]|uniref:ABC transporter permease n=1 Tax=Sphingomonas sp. NFR15 TaxID=1566282 RepID=UPI0008871A38|nr:ABC transporter permease [Sphingomonas sp. NFR15]SDA32968.1 ABC-2 type transport system permease protein [Sphingomonas sp. NFR15]